MKIIKDDGEIYECEKIEPMTSPHGGYLLVDDAYLVHIVDIYCITDDKKGDELSYYFMTTD